MNADVQRFAIIGCLGASAYIIATCPCEQMGLCKRELFLAVTAVPFGFAVYNFIAEGKACPLK
jgi:hypothetical protein